MTWSSGVETVATVSERGVVTALAAGSTQINAVSGSLSASRSVTVRNPDVSPADTATAEDLLSQDTTTVSIPENDKEELVSVQDTTASVRPNKSARPRISLLNHRR